MKSTGSELEVLLQRIDELQLSDRLERWKAATLEAQPMICTERAVLAVEAWRESLGEDIEIRRAKLLQRILERIPVFIHDWQLLAGSESAHVYGGHPDVDLCASSIMRVMRKDKISIGSPVVDAMISEETRQVLLECAEFFRGQTVAEHVRKAWDSAVGIPQPGYASVAGTMGIPGPYIRAPIVFEELLAKGLRGVIREAESNLRGFRDREEDEVEKVYFWQAAVLVCEALIVYARRHAKLALELAQSEQNPQRRRELEEIAGVCEWVPENPPRTFHEAIQFMTFILLALKLETPHLPGDCGRLDQYLWPYLERDLASGATTLEKAAELIGDFAAYRGSVVSVMEMVFIESQQTVVEVNHITLGGVDANGNDVANPLTYLILHVLGLLKIPEPHCTVRWHPGIPSWIMRKAIETNTRLSGTPQFMNDLHVEEYWTKQGVPLEEIRDWSGVGCLPPIPRNSVYNLVGVINQAKVLELVLHNGVDSLAGKRIGLETGEPSEFKTFDELLGAFERQCAFWARRLTWLGRLAWHEESRYLRLPFLSCVLHGCVERGTDIVRRGTPNFFTFCEDRAAVDAADSLMAIKELVFDSQVLSMDELLKALDTNFEGETGEKIRRMCLSAPKFGNDIDEVDRLTGHVAAFGGSTIASHRTPDGRCFVVDRPGVSWHYSAGKQVAALPNGRKSREPLNDGSMSPMRGQDTCGPTAVFRSVLKAGFKESLYSILNLKFPLTLLRSQEARNKLSDLTETYLRNGGIHVQYNLVDAETLRDAQLHPESHRDLVVRVGGFNAYFVQLTPDVQNDIIARTEQGL